MSKIISYLCIFNMLIFSCSLPAMQNGNNGKGKQRSPIPAKWRQLGHVIKQPYRPAPAEPAKPCISKRRFLEDIGDQPNIKTRTFRYKNLEPSDWEEQAQRQFGEGSSDSTQPAVGPSALGGGSTPPSDPVRRFFLHRIADFMRNPYGIIAATLVATAAITAVRFWPYLRHKGAQLYKKIVS